MDEAQLIEQGWNEPEQTDFAYCGLQDAQAQGAE